MAINTILETRSNNQCELCGSAGSELHAYTVPPREDNIPDNQVVLCAQCYDAVSAGMYSDANHWRMLTGSIWSEIPAVQALSYKILSQLAPAEEWANETIESVYLDESVIQWAGAEEAQRAAVLVHKDAYGVSLEAGDTVILTQNLNVKGANFIAPKGTIVRKIRLVPDNDEQIEGKINGDTIVILTKYVRKQA